MTKPLSIFALAAFLATSPSGLLAGVPQSQTAPAPASREQSPDGAPAAQDPQQPDQKADQAPDKKSAKDPDNNANAENQEFDRDLRPDTSHGKDLPDFAQISPTLYRGAQASKEGFRQLAAMGVTIDVDLRGDRESERKFVNSLGMRYVPIRWECSFPKDKTFVDFLTLIHDNPGKKIFVHCRVGDDRTGMMIAAFRMAEQGWPADKAEKEMERFGFNFAHRRLICPGLSSYEEHFPERFETKPAFRELRERQAHPDVDKAKADSSKPSNVETNPAQPNDANQNKPKPNDDSQKPDDSTQPPPKNLRLSASPDSSTGASQNPGGTQRKSTP